VRNPPGQAKCRFCTKRAGYSLPGVPDLCKEHYLLVWQRVEPDKAPVDVTKARSTGTTVHLYRGPVYESDPSLPWELVCEDHGGIVCMETRAQAKSWMSAPEGWCPGCQEPRRE
jgi:hypothetical protein